MLLLEEMWRVLAFLTWQVEWWSGLSSACHFERLADVEGSVAYAKHQSTLRESMLKKFEQLWKIVPAIVAAELNDGIADTDGMPTIEGPPPLDTDD